MNLFDYLKNAFVVLVFLQLAPGLVQGLKKQYGNILMPKTRVGVIKMQGVMTHSTTYAKQLHAFFKDSDIKAILLKVESSGSAAGTGEALCNEILALKKEYPKPIITLTENICASGAYYIASATDHIISSGQALIGSIGSTIPYLFQFHDFLLEHHIDYQVVKAGAYKAMTDPFAKMSDVERAQLQKVVDSSYEQFVADVAQNRKLSVTTAPDWADGKLFTGKQALEHGLVDELGSSYQAIAYIKNKKLIDGEIEWVYAQTPSNLWKRLFSGDDMSDDGSMFNTCSLQIATLMKHLVQQIHGAVIS